MQGPPGPPGEKGQAGVDGIPGSTGERGDPGLCFPRTPACYLEDVDGCALLNIIAFLFSNTIYLFNLHRITWSGCPWTTWNTWCKRLEPFALFLHLTALVGNT